ncbi:MAG TPA: hypothetical protein VHO70_03175 [Chitinispirillaceae bacterium]|nr:hypothetical protein [Chitinispirillaceae bacterium]
MRSFSLSLLLCLFSILTIQSAASAEGNKWVEIKVGFANIYKQLDPESDIIKQAKKGDHLELVYDGTSWYQVKVGNATGWVERRSGDIVNRNTQSPVAAIIIILLIIGGTTGGIVYFNKNKPQRDDV